MKAISIEKVEQHTSEFDKLIDKNVKFLKNKVRKLLHVF